MQIRVYIIFVLRHEVMFLCIGSRVKSNYERLTSCVVCQLPNRVPEPHATPPPTATTHPSKTNWQYPYHDDVVKWKHFPRYWPFVRGIHRSPVNSPHKGQWLGALMFSLMCAWINGWVNNREAGDLRCHRVHCDVTVTRGTTGGRNYQLRPLSKWRRFACAVSGGHFRGFQSA